MHFSSSAAWGKHVPTSRINLETEVIKSQVVSGVCVCINMFVCSIKGLPHL